MEDSIDNINAINDLLDSKLRTEQLKTSIKSNEANTKLAQETLRHFQESKINSDKALMTSKNALTASKWLTGITICILIIQTGMTTLPQTVDSPKLESELSLLIKEIKASQIRQERTLSITQNLDSLKLELREQSIKLDSIYNVINKINKHE